MNFASSLVLSLDMIYTMFKSTYLKDGFNLSIRKKS